MAPMTYTAGQKGLGPMPTATLFPIFFQPPKWTGKRTLVLPIPRIPDSVRIWHNWILRYLNRLMQVSVQLTNCARMAVLLTCSISLLVLRTLTGVGLVRTAMLLYPIWGSLILEFRSPGTMFIPYPPMVVARRRRPVLL